MDITLNIEPVGQMRSRACIRGKHASVYKAKEQAQAEQTLAALLQPFQPQEPLEGPLLLYVNCYLAMPKSKSKKWLDAAARGIERPTKKPDADNLAKHLKDVMTQMRFWDDDKQIVELVVRKWWSSRPRWEISLKPALVQPLGFNYIHEEETA